jgi:hypothetical protein
MARAPALEMTFCSRTIAWANACVVNAVAAIVVSGISQDLARMVSSSLLGSAPYQTTARGDQEAK